MGFIGSIVRWFIATTLGFLVFEFGLTLVADGPDPGAFLDRLRPELPTALVLGTAFAIAFYVSTLVRASTGWPRAPLHVVAAVGIALVLGAVMLSVGTPFALAFAPAAIGYGLFALTGLVAGLVYIAG